jgi:basic amino acid/polyamine antiporter, APA family
MSSKAPQQDPSGAPSPRANLKRSITLTHLVGIEVGQSIGAGIFALTGLALARTGPSVFLAFLAAAVPVGLAMAVLGMIGSGMPISGGTYYYGSRYFSPVASFAGVWAYLLGAVLGMFPLYALTGAGFLKAAFPALPTIPTALALLFVFYVANLLGARIAMWVQAVMVAVLLTALLVFIGAGLPRVSAANLVPLFPRGLGGFAVASAILTFTILGANAAVELGDEIQEPRRNIPLSFAISIPVVVVLYVAIGLVAAGVAPWSGQEVSLAAVAGSFLGRGTLMFFLIGGGFLAVVTTLNATYLWGTKSLIVIAEDGLLPKAAAAVNRRFGTPHWLLTFIFAVSAVSLVVAGDRVETFAIFASLGGIIIFFPVMGAALRLPRRHPEVAARSAMPLGGFLAVAAPVGGLILSLLTVAILLVDLADKAQGWLFLGIFAAWVAGGAVYAALRLRRGKTQFMSRTSGK